MLFGNFVKRVCTVGWMLVGLIVAAMVAQGRRTPLAGGSRERVRICVPAAAVSRRARPAGRVDSRGEHVGVFGLHGRRRARCSPKGFTGRTFVPNRSDRHYLWVGRISGAVDHDARRPLRDVPDPERAVHVSAHRDAVDVRRHQRARRHRLAARQPLGRAGEPGRRAGDELPAVLPRGRAPGSTGIRTCFSRRSSPASSRSSWSA